MHRGFERVGDAGVHTVEGTKAGSRAAGLTKQREQDQLAYEAKKRKIEEESARGVGKIDDKFDKTVLNTVLSGGGLQTKAQYVEAQRRQDAPAAPGEAKGGPKEAGVEAGAAAAAGVGGGATKAAKRAKLKRKMQLSFGDDDDDEDEDEEAAAAAARPPLKCPDVETAFLPDRARTEAEASRVAGLKAEFEALQARNRLRPLDVVFSYWDGSGHRRALRTTRGATIGAFLSDARAALEGDFPELRRCHVENLIYVKEDLMLPHHLTFHDLILSKARGKSGPGRDEGATLANFEPLLSRSFSTRFG